MWSEKNDVGEAMWNCCLKRLLLVLLPALIAVVLASCDRDVTNEASPAAKPKVHNQGGGQIEETYATFSSGLNQPKKVAPPPQN